MNFLNWNKTLALVGFETLRLSVRTCCNCNNISGNCSSKISYSSRLPSTGRMRRSSQFIEPTIHANRRMDGRTKCSSVYKTNESASVWMSGRMIEPNVWYESITITISNWRLLPVLQYDITVHYGKRISMISLRTTGLNWTNRKIISLVFEKYSKEMENIYNLFIMLFLFYDFCFFFIFIFLALKIWLNRKKEMETFKIRH